MKTFVPALTLGLILSTAYAAWAASACCMPAYFGPSDRRNGARCAPIAGDPARSASSTAGCAESGGDAGSPCIGGRATAPDRQPHGCVGGQGQWFIGSAGFTTNPQTCANKAALECCAGGNGVGCP